MNIQEDGAPVTAVGNVAGIGSKSPDDIAGGQGKRKDRKSLMLRRGMPMQSIGKPLSELRSELNAIIESH